MPLDSTAIRLTCSCTNRMSLIKLDHMKAIRELYILKYFYFFYSPIIQIGFLINLNLPQNPIYFERHPADHNRIIYSTPKNTTKQISIQKSVSFAKLLYISIVESTLNIRQTSTSINLKQKKK